eukprot:8662038-Pyramimonas_sp.AAC.1
MNDCACSGASLIHLLIRVARSMAASRANLGEAARPRPTAAGPRGRGGTGMNRASSCQARHRAQNARTLTLEGSLYNLQNAPDFWTFPDKPRHRGPTRSLQTVALLGKARGGQRLEVKAGRRTNCQQLHRILTRGFPRARGARIA